jgi:hypothetical protein
MNKAKLIGTRDITGTNLEGAILYDRDCNELYIVTRVSIGNMSVHYQLTFLEDGNRFRSAKPYDEFVRELKVLIDTEGWELYKDVTIEVKINE